MAENNRNRQGSWRQQHDWEGDYGQQQQFQEGEPNYTISENRGYKDAGRNAGSEGGWQSRYERQMYTGREGDFDNGYGQRNYGRQSDSDYNHGGLTSGYQDFGGDYASRDSRNLYDRGYQGMGRRDYQNRENRLGGANYDRYGDHGRYDQHSYRGFEGNYGRSDWGNRDFGRHEYRHRDYGHGEPEERSWWDRTTDEVSSWFGDEEAYRRRERDRMINGMHRGKGPRNYSRSDNRIQEDINDRLSDDPFVDATDIDVAVTSGEVTLTGTVDHRSSKRRAEDIAESISGVKNVENRLRVVQESAASVSSSPVAGRKNEGKGQ